MSKKIVISPKRLSYSLVCMLSFVIYDPPYCIKFDISLFIALQMLFSAFVIFWSVDWKNSRISKIEGIIILYSISILLSSIVNFINIFKALNYGLSLVAMFYLTKKICKLDIKILTRSFVIIISAYVLYNMYVIMTMSEGYYLNGSNQPIYFVGDKFKSGYIYYLFIAFVGCDDFLHKGKIYYSKIYAILLVGIFISSYIESSTTLIAMAIITTIFIFKNFIMPRMSLKLICIFICLTNVMVIVFRTFEKVPFLSYFIYNVLGKSTTLTGRFDIYNNILPIIKKAGFFGYGYGNNIVSKILYYENAQNGFLDIMVDFGIFGLIVFVVILLKFLNTTKKQREREDVQCILLGIIAFLICAIVEIPFGSYFFRLLILLYFVLKYKYSKTVGGLDGK